MSDLKNIVDVTINRATRTVSRLGFGIPLIMGSNAAFVERIRSYSSLAEVLVDFAITTAEHKMATAIFAQNPAPPTIKIGRVGIAFKQKVNVDVTTVEDDAVYSVTINGVTSSITSDGTATASEIVDLLIAQITTDAEPVTTTDNGDDFDIEADVAGTDFSIQVDTQLTVLTIIGYTEDAATALAAIRNEDDDFYFILLTSRDEDDAKILDSVVEGLTKLMVFCSLDNAIQTNSATDIASVLSGAALDRSICFYSELQEEYPEAAWVGKIAPKDPGSVTWKFKTLAGITPQVFTSAQKAFVKGKSCNLYNEVGGVNITEEGVVASGEFIDIMRGTDWIHVNIQADVYGGLVNVDKVPYTNAGIDTIRNLILGVLNTAIDMGILSGESGKEPVVIAPDEADVSSADKAVRLLDNVEFTGFYAGAIHKVKMVGNLSV